MDDLVTRLAAGFVRGVRRARQARSDRRRHRHPPLSDRRRIAGRVLTVKLDQDDGRAVDARHLGTTAIEAAQPGRRHRRRTAHGHRRRRLGRQPCRSAPGCAASPASSSKAPRGTSTNAACTTSRCSPDTPRAPPADASSKRRPTYRSRSATSPVSPGDYVVADGSAVVFVGAGRDRTGARCRGSDRGARRGHGESLREGTPISQVMGKVRNDAEEMTRWPTSPAQTTTFSGHRSSTRHPSATRWTGWALPASA